jgi:hypothetical protein
MNGFRSVTLASCPDTIIVRTVQSLERKYPTPVCNVRENDLCFLVVDLHNSSSQRLPMLVDNNPRYISRCTLSWQRRAE